MAESAPEAICGASLECTLLQRKLHHNSVSVQVWPPAAAIGISSVRAAAIGMTMMIPCFFFDWAMCSQTLSSPAIAWLAKPQAEERRGWEADNHSSDSVSKRSPGLASRLTSATDNEAPSRHQPLSDPSSTPVAGYRSPKSHRGSPTHPHQMALG